MNRREFLAATALTTSITVASGCLGTQQASGTQNYGPVTDPDPSETETGLAPNPANVAEPDFDVSSFATFTAGNETATEVRLAPLEIVWYWHRRQKARFIDARTEAQYEQTRIAGAEFSPAPNGGNDDPVEDWGENERIVAYCTCPHHLSGIRAGNLIENGYTGVYVLEPGMQPWAENGYPVAGTNTSKTSFVDDYSNVQDESNGEDSDDS